MRIGIAETKVIDRSHAHVHLRIVYEFLGGIDKCRHHRAFDISGERCIMALIGKDGYYTVLVMVLSTAHSPLPEGAPLHFHYQPVEHQYCASIFRIAGCDDSAKACIGCTKQAQDP